MRNKREFIKQIKLEDIDGMGLEEFIFMLDEYFDLIDEYVYNDIEVVASDNAIDLYGTRPENEEELKDRLNRNTEILAERLKSKK